jgi:L-fuconolactonase
VIVDAHHHLWDPGARDYPWMTDELAPIRRRFGPEDLAPLLAAAGVDATVVVQAVSSVEETRELLAIAAATDFVAGVVGWVDLADPDVAATLADLRAGPGGDRLVGVRHQVHDEPDPAWLLRPEVQRGIAAVGAAGLVYDLLVRSRELPGALETARQRPEVRFVIDHLAKPRIAAGPDDPAWAAAMAPFSDLGNVDCKLSGMVTEADWRAWRPADLRPYVDRVVGWFGPDRCLFGSDWPVCLLAGTYGQVYDALAEAIADLEAAARAAIMGGTAARVYGLRPS